MATKLAAMFVCTNCGDLLTPSNEPILDSTFQIKKAFPHVSDPMVLAQVMTGPSPNDWRVEPRASGTGRPPPQ